MWSHFISILCANLFEQCEIAWWCHDMEMFTSWRNNNVVIASKRRHFDVITSKWRRFDVIMTLLLRNMFAGLVPYVCLSWGESADHDVFHSQWAGNVDLCCYPKQAVEQTVNVPVIRDSIMLMPNLWYGLSNNQLRFQSYYEYEI